MAANIYDWSSTAANNASADTGLTWAEGQAPDTVNDSARVMMKRVKDITVDIGGSLSAGGSANALTITLNSGFTAYADGQLLAFRATAINTAAATINVNSIGAKSIRKMTSATGESALIGSEIQIGGIYLAQYSAALNSTAGGWLLVNPTSLAEVTLTTVQTLTNKTLTTPTINGGVIAQPTLTLLQGTTPTAEGDIRWDATNNRLAVGDAAATQTFSPNPATTVDNTVPRHDGTKGFTQTSGVTIDDSDKLSAPGGFAGASGTLPFQKVFESSQQVITSSGSLTIPHGLGVKPKLVVPVLQCVTAVNGYSIGDELVIGPHMNSGNAAGRGQAIIPDATNIFIRFGSDSTDYYLIAKDTGVANSIAVTNWRLVVRAWA